MACLDNIATHSGAGLGSEKGGDAEADGTVQPSEDGKGHVMEGLRGTRRAKVHCCASVKVHPVQKSESETGCVTPSPTLSLQVPSPSPKPGPSMMKSTTQSHPPHTRSHSRSTECRRRVRSTREHTPSTTPLMQRTVSA